jgi:hypothetical protein
LHSTKLASILTLLFADPPTVSILWNIKILITAVLFRITFKKRFSRQKWLAVFLLLVGCVASQADKMNQGCSTVVHGEDTITDQLQCAPNVQSETDSCSASFSCDIGGDPLANHTLRDSIECLSSFACKAARFAKNSTTVTAMMHSTHGMIREEFGDKDEHREGAMTGQKGRWLFGLLLIFIGTTVTSLAGVYSEWVLKDTKKVTFFLQNMIMNFWGVVFNGGALFALHYEDVATKVGHSSLDSLIL